MNIQHFNVPKIHRRGVVCNLDKNQFAQACKSAKNKSKFTSARRRNKPVTLAKVK